MCMTHGQEDSFMLRSQDFTNIGLTFIGAGFAFGIVACVPLSILCFIGACLSFLGSAVTFHPSQNSQDDF